MMEQNTAVLETARVWELDPAHSVAEFTVKHMMITKVRGRFTDVQGRIEVDADNPESSRVDVEIGAGSIDTGKADRDEHLRSADFLDAGSHEKLRFRSKRVEGFSGQEGDEFEVVGDLTIRGTTREVVLAARFEGSGQDPWGGQRLAFSGDLKIDRTDYGLEWNQMLETGGVLVGNEVKIHVEAQAVAVDDEG